MIFGLLLLGWADSVDLLWQIEWGQKKIMKISTNTINKHYKKNFNPSWWTVWMKAWTPGLTSTAHVSCLSQGRGIQVGTSTTSLPMGTKEANYVTNRITGGQRLTNGSKQQSTFSNWVWESLKNFCTHAVHDKTNPQH